MSSIYHSQTVYNLFREMKLCKIFTQTIISHMMGIMIAMFSRGYKGKAVDVARYSASHRTTIAHFLNRGKWNDGKLEEILKAAVVRVIYGEAERTGKPVFCIVDDTIASKTKPYSWVSFIQYTTAQLRAVSAVIPMLFR